MTAITTRGDLEDPCCRRFPCRVTEVVDDRGAPAAILVELADATTVSFHCGWRVLGDYRWRLDVALSDLAAALGS